MAFTNWKELKKIDAHIHILPDAVHKANPNSEDAWLCIDLHRYLHMMEELHIEKAIIMPINDPWLMSMEFTVEAVHKNLYEMKQRYPGKFYAFADIDTRNSSTDSVDAIRRAIQAYGLDGIKIHPNNTGVDLDSEYNQPIFDFAQEHNIPVAIHSYPNSEGDRSAAYRKVKALEQYPNGQPFPEAGGHLSYLLRHSQSDGLYKRRSRNDFIREYRKDFKQRIM